MNDRNPIPTTYRGITYRSRVEARWAVFFEHMGWPAAYEPEGFDMEGTWYLPDFWLPDLGVYVEIKAADPTDEEVSRCRKLAEHTGKQVWLIAGSPGSGTYKVLVFRHEEFVDETATTILTCRRCDRPVLHYQGKTEEQVYWGWREIGEKCSRHDCGVRDPIVNDKLRAALNAAQDARFGVHD